VFVGTDFSDAQTLGAAAWREKHRFAGAGIVARNGMKGRVVVRPTPLPGRENLWKHEAQGRYSHETRREGFRAERSVKRLRKPGGAAQPGVW
jgi:hypothetical protein